MDEAGNRYELKSSTKGDIGTSRDIGDAYFRLMEQRYLISAMGTNTVFGFRIDRIYFLPPSALASWIEEKRSRMREERQLLETLIAAAPGALAEHQLQRLRQVVARGVTLNNPKIGRSFIEAHGILVDGDDVASRLRQLVREHPLPTSG